MRFSLLYGMLGGAKTWEGGRTMARKNSRNTRGRIISAAWKLFYEQGYDDTTVEDIVFESETSKGSFYHYFDGKDSLMGTLAYVFDEKYEELERSEALAAAEDAVDKLILLNHELYVMIGCSPPSFWPGARSICWTGTGSTSSCCGRSSAAGRRRGSSAGTSASTRS